MTTSIAFQSRGQFFEWCMEISEGSARAKPKDIATTLFDHRSSFRIMANAIPPATLIWSERTQPSSCVRKPA
jgi:hypothetical protein